MKKPFGANVEWLATSTLSTISSQYYGFHHKVPQFVVTALAGAADCCAASPTGLRGAVVVISEVPRSFVLASRVVFSNRLDSQKVGKKDSSMMVSTTIQLLATS